MDSIFPKRNLLILVLVGLVSFVGPIIPILLTDEASTSTTTGANSYSRSGIGHHALYNWLIASEYPTLQNRYVTPQIDSGPKTWVFAEPSGKDFLKPRISALHSNHNAIIVLPKWKAIPDPENTSWVKDAELINLQELKKILKQLDLPLNLLRIQNTTGWQSSIGTVAPTLNQPQLLPRNTGNPLIWSDDGVLVAEHHIGGKNILVLSDPDLINNHGIQLGQNIDIVDVALKKMAPSGGTTQAVVFDEVTHGFRHDPSLTKLLLNPPYVVIVIVSLGALIVYISATIVRFGSPLDWAPPFSRGYVSLIDNTTSLLARHGITNDILQRYIRHQAYIVFEKLNAPPKLSWEEAGEWAERIGKARGIDQTLSGLQDELLGLQSNSLRDQARALKLASKAHKWKKDMLNE